ncbi:MAG: peptidoglycan-binding protein [Saprospiraceae bacterium]
MKFFRIFCILVILAVANFSYAQNLTIGNSDDFCYAKLKSPDVYDEIPEEILVQPASRKSIKVPAEYGTTTEQIMIQPESRQLFYVPATYETVTEQVIDQPESTKLINIPAVFENQTERVLIKEESKRLVVVPATYETVTEQIMISPASTRFEFVPAVFEKVTDKVMAKAASERYVPVPVQYETIMEQVEIEPATVSVETLTPEMKKVEERILVKPAHTKWVETVGDKNCLSADPKDCIVWCLVEVPDEYKIVYKTVNMGCDGSGVANSGCKKEIQVPAIYSSKPKRVIKTPATTRKEMIPAEYTSVTRTVLKTPAQTNEIEIPAVYETYIKQVVKTAATTREEIIPAEYKNIVKKVMVSAARTEEQIIPATYKTITKQVVKTPASTREEIIPAVYETVSKRVLNVAEQVRIEEIPAVYKTVIKKVIREKGDMEWRRIVCPKHQTAQLNIEMQKALRAAGFNPGPNDNVFGPRTYAAMVAFQKANNMWQGHLDYKTAEALNLTLSPDAFQNVAEAGIAVPAEVASDLGEEIVMTSRGGEETSTTSSGSGSGSVNSSEVGAGSSNTNEGASSSSNNNNSSSGAGTMSSAEQQMIDEINVMRRDPKGYVKHVEEYINQVKNDDMLDAAYKSEEISTAKELIQELKTLNPLPILEPHQGLHRVGITHGKDVQKQGMIGHKGSDGSWPWDRVRRDTELSDGNENLVAGGNTVKESLMILLVDSGIPGRGHRKTLLEPKWTQCGVYMIGDVGGIPNAWIQVFGSK